MQMNSIYTPNVVAIAALTAEHFCTALGAVATAGGAAFGVNRSDAAIGDIVAVDVLGSAIVVAGGAIAKGAYIDVGAAGVAVTHAAGKVVAQALQPAAQAGDRIEVYLIQSSA